MRLGMSTFINPKVCLKMDFPLKIFFLNGEDLSTEGQIWPKKFYYWLNREFQGN